MIQPGRTRRHIRCDYSVRCHGRASARLRPCPQTRRRPCISCSEKSIRRSPTCCMGCSYCTSAARSNISSSIRSGNCREYCPGEGSRKQSGCGNQWSSSPANKSLRGSRRPEAGVRGLPSPFIKIYERGRETPHPSLLPLLPKRKDILDEILGLDQCGLGVPLQCRGDGNTDQEGGAARGGTSDIEPAVEGADPMAHGGQAVRADGGQPARGNACAVVGDLHHDRVLIQIEREVHGFGRRMLHDVRERLLGDAEQRDGGLGGELGFFFGVKLTAFEARPAAVLFQFPAQGSDES